MKIRDVDVANVDEIVINGSKYQRRISNLAQKGGKKGIAMSDITWAHTGKSGKTEQVPHKVMCDRIHNLSWNFKFNVWPSGTTINARYAKQYVSQETN